MKALFPSLVGAACVSVFMLMSTAVMATSEPVVIDVDHHEDSQEGDHSNENGINESVELPTIQPLTAEQIEMLKSVDPDGVMNELPYLLGVGSKSGQSISADAENNPAGSEQEPVMIDLDQ